MVGARWTARHRPVPAPAAEDTCRSDDWQVASLRARVQFLEGRLAEVNAAPSSVAAETELRPSEEAAPVEAVAAAVPAAPAPQPALAVASTLNEEEWARDAEDRLLEAARGAGAKGESANVTCTREECRVEITAGEGEPLGERVHKILSEVPTYLQNVNVESDDVTGKTTMVFPRRAVAQGG